MRQWLVLLSGLLVWTAHFFGVYIAASLFPGSVIARWLTILLTVAGLLAVFLLGRRTLKTWRGASGDDMGQWIGGLALMGNALAGVAILYQGLPAILI